MAVVAESLLEEKLAELTAEGWGIVQLPPPELGPDAAADWLALSAEQVAEYLRSGYEVQLVDDGAWREPLAAALRELGAEPL